jgi:hypothetical protein
MDDGTRGPLMHPDHERITNLIPSSKASCM